MVLAAIAHLRIRKTFHRVVRDFPHAVANAVQDAQELDLGHVGAADGGHLRREACIPQPDTCRRDKDVLELALDQSPRAHLPVASIDGNDVRTKFPREICVVQVAWWDGNLSYDRLLHAV